MSVFCQYPHCTSLTKGMAFGDHDKTFKYCAECCGRELVRVAELLPDYFQEVEDTAWDTVEAKALRGHSERIGQIGVQQVF